jgi:prefoldin subunit 5
MNNEQVIMEQLDHLGQEIATLTDSARSLRELRDDLSPRVNETVKVLIEELAEIEADVQFEDLVSLLKNLMRNVRNLTWSVEQLKNLIDFIRTVEPLLKSVVPQVIIYLDKLEQQGVFLVFASMMRVLEKIAETYTPEDIEQIGNGLVPLVGVAKKLTTPEALNLLDKAADVPARVDLSQAKAVGPFGMLFALGNSEVKQGMGVVLELTKALSLLKNGERAEESGA